MDKVNELWAKYEKSHKYIQSKNLVTKTNRNWDFYIGNQWKGVKSGGNELPSLNFIKPIIKYKVSTVSQHSMVANYSDMKSRSELQPIYEFLNQRFSQSWEKGKMATTAWQANKQSAIQGDSYVFWGGTDTNEQAQLLSNTAVLLGDENTNRIQDQPYIIIVERLSVNEVKRIAKANKVPKDEIDLIFSDDKTEDQIVNTEEVKDKVTTIIYLTKDENGIVNKAKATKNCIIEPLHPLQNTQNGEMVGGLRSYPLASMIWEPKPNSARGISEVETLIPNQLELNKTLARRAMTVKYAAFPRIAYDSNAIENPDDLKLVGAPIAVNSGGAQSINQAISYLNTANISSDADRLCDDLLTLSRELAGAGDYATGNVNPEQASGQAIIAVRDQSQVPLNEQVSSYTQFVEDVALVWFDMWVAFEPDSFVIEQEGQTRNISYDEIIKLKPSIRIDVSQDNAWTKQAEQIAIDNLLEQNRITLEQYANLIPDNGSIPKGKLLSVIETQKQEQAEQMAQQQMAQMQGQQDAVQG